VQYGLGWIPAGGFVALPQMAPMEALEGGEKPAQPLPAISPLDKIIVAFAGPLFSMLLALASAVIVWQVGKPRDFIPSQEVGYVMKDSPAAEAGLQPGDRIIEINDKPVHGFAGSLDSITERIILSRGEEITYTVERPGRPEPIRLASGFKTEKTHWYQRSGLRQIGIDSASEAIINKVSPNSPAADAGLQKGDRIVSIDGNTLYSLMQFSQYLREHEWKSVTLGIETAGGENRQVELTPERPVKPAGMDPMVGIEWDMSAEVDTRIVHPKPVEQVTDSLKMMWITITSVLAPDSNIGPDHLSGPVGIGSMMFDFLKMDDGWRRILSFMVLFNVNLAVLNMLPFPVLDGGHITLSLLEMISGRKVRAKPLEILQTVCALLLITLMLFVTSKDIGDKFGRGGGKKQEIVFPE
jgi:regulator of sigma E protease